MFRHLGYTETSIGTINFSVNDYGSFEIQTPKSFYAVYENELIEKDGKVYFKLPERDFKILNDVVFSEIEIPVDILEDMEKALKEFKLRENSIGSTETTKGKVYFSLSADGKIIAKIGGKATKTEKIYTVENNRVVVAPDLSIESVFVKVPQEVEAEFERVKSEKRSRELHLVYAGRSLLTGIDYYKFNCEVSEGAWNRIKELFEYFGEDGDIKSLEGWLTSNPKLVEEYLRLRKNTVATRKAEIEKQIEKAIKTNAKIIEKLTA